MTKKQKIEEKGMGALPSEFDPRTHIIADAEVPEILEKGGKPYSKEDIDDQHKVGICTAISLTQNRQKVTKKKYSPDFQYLLQKTYFDYGWYEGSSAFSALKVGFNYGFLPAELWTHTTEDDRKLSYKMYKAKLQAIPEEEIKRLITLCVDKIGGYGQIVVNNPQSIARGIIESDAGLICRYDSGKTWYTDINGKHSWDATKINPIRKPIPATSGHLIIASEFDFTRGNLIKHPNTWGTSWCLEGQCHINNDDYRMTEAWLILPNRPVIPPVPKYSHTKTLRKGMKGWEVASLQRALNKILETTLKDDGIFGELTAIAVRSFQSRYGLVVDSIVGVKTGSKLTQLA